MEKNIKNIQEFADAHGIEFRQEGEVGFGRECVGLIDEDNYVNYNPTDNNCRRIEHLYDSRLNSIAPENAYHKHDCFAVLGRGETAIAQLSDWVDKLKELGVELVEYETGDTGMQALLTGATGKAFKVK